MKAPDWTPEEEQYLRDHFQRESDEQLAANLGRGFRAVKNRRALLCLFRPKGRYSCSWVPEE